MYVYVCMCVMPASLLVSQRGKAAARAQVGPALWHRRRDRVRDHHALLQRQRVHGRGRLQRPRAAARARRVLRGSSEAKAAEVTPCDYRRDK